MAPATLLRASDTVKVTPRELMFSVSLTQTPKTLGLNTSFRSSSSMIHKLYKATESFLRMKLMGHPLYKTDESSVALAGWGS